MINSEHGKKKISTFHKGTDYDVHPELSELREGHYIDANNMSIRTDNGLDYSLQKIKGETVHYNNYNGIDYQCTGNCYVNFHVVNIWVPLLGVSSTRPVKIEVDGVVMMSTDVVDWDVDHPFQIDIDDSCNGGEFAITDFKNFPYIFSVKDMIDCYGSADPIINQTYFTLFNPSLYTVQLNLPLHHPVFTNLDYISANGLPHGEYSYSIRYADSTGNKTAWSVATPYIPVPKVFTSESLTYHYNITMGGVSDITTPTNYGIRLRFRVENLSGYEYIEIKRVAQNQGQALNWMATPQVLKLTTDASGSAVDILTNPFDIIEWTDSKNVTGWIDETDEESSQEISSFERAKAIRYYQRRLVLMNIQYPSKDISGTVDFNTFVTGNELACPTMENMGKEGHYDPWNQTYLKSLPTGEKFGWGIAVYDEQGGRSFVAPYVTPTDTSLKNYQMPNRRDNLGTVSPNSFTYTNTFGKGAVVAADTTNTPNHTFEVFDIDITTQKEVLYDEISISSDNSVTYNPLTPKSSVDPLKTGLSYRINDKFLLDNNGNDVDNEQKIFNPTYYSLGMTFAGVKSLPSWGKAFSIVRTKRAGRIIAQGLGVYDTAGIPKNSLNDNTTKKNDGMICYFPDIANGFSIDPASINNNYWVQFVSPLGFTTEVYGADMENLIVLGQKDKSIDMISYARLILNNNNTLPGLTNTEGDTQYYTKFGKWRNDFSVSTSTVFGGAGTSGNELKITSLIALTNQSGHQRGMAYEMRTQGSMYGQGSCGDHRGPANHPNAMNFHEPWYIINIIDKGAEVDDGNIVSYVETGHYQKLDSTIGYGNDSSQSLLLTDERWEDCIPYYFSGSSTPLTTVVQDSYIYIDDKRWINVQYKTPAQITTILSALQANGSYSFVDSNSQSVTIYGVYKNTITGKNYYIDFNYFNTAYDKKYFIPTPSERISVKYDVNAPIRVYAGDVTVGECVFPIFDCMCDNGGGISSSSDQIFMKCPLPHTGVHFDTDYLQIENASRYNPNTYQNTHTMYFDAIRQWVAMFTCESVTNLPMRYAIDSAAGSYSSNKAFPLVNYVQRPLKWRTASLPDNFDDVSGTPKGHISAQYKTDFPDEFNYWQYGGFYFTQMANTDYAKETNDNGNYAKPKVGFKEKTRFCSRVIWSQKRAINEQDDPNLKTFPSLNVFDISDAMQEIKYAYDDDTTKGNNLYAITGKGVCLLITDKRILSDLTGNELAYITPDVSFIGGEYWLSKIVGMNDEMWRSAAEYDNQLFFANNESAYKFESLAITDILRENTGSYYTKLYPYLKNVKSGYNTPVCAVYDRNHEEYWLHIGYNKTLLEFPDTINLGQINTAYDYLISTEEYVQLSCTDPYGNGIVYLPNTMAVGSYFYLENIDENSMRLIGQNFISQFFQSGSTVKVTKDTSTFGWSIEGTSVYGKTFMYINPDEKKCWAGTNDHSYDRMTCCTKIDGLNDLRVVGMKELKTYKTDSGLYLNGSHSPVDAFVTFAISPSVGYTKEFIDVVCNSNVKPTEIEFAESLTALPEANVIAANIRDYRGNYYSFIPRKTAGLRDRLQNDVCFIKIKHNIASNFNVVSFATSYKLLK